jgi:hypothetical protein
MTPHSLFRRVRDILSGDLGAHRHLPVDRDEAAKTENSTTIPVVERRVHGTEQAKLAWNRRRADLRSLDNVAIGELPNWSPATRHSDQPLSGNRRQRDTDVYTHS